MSGLRAPGCSQALAPQPVKGEGSQASRFVVLGAGAIGGLLAARLALAGHEVAVLARGANLEAIRSAGLQLSEPDGRVQHARGVAALAGLADLADWRPRASAADGAQPAYLLLCVKAHQVAALRPAIVDALAADPGASLVTFVNGVPWWYFQRQPGPWAGRVVRSVDPDGELAATLDPTRVLGAVVYPAAELTAPGQVRLIEGERFTLGELDGSRSERVLALSRALGEAGFKAPVSRELRTELWLKLWGNLSLNPVSALTHATLEDIVRFAPTRELARVLMAEGQAVAQALGVRLRMSLEQRLAGAEAVGAHKTSMLQDLEAGRALELDALVGAVVELGELAGVATPMLRAVHALTRLAARQAQGVGIRRGAA